VINIYIVHKKNSRKFQSYFGSRIFINDHQFSGWKHTSVSVSHDSLSANEISLFLMAI